jgi:DNA-binding response OmpR family regulator
MARILVVDDDMSLAIAIQMVLENDGFDVLVAHNGRRALEIIDSTELDVILVDMFMPGMDGLDSIREFCRCAPTVPIIAMSGSAFRSPMKQISDILALATDVGAAFGLQKPFRSSDLIAAIKAVSAFSLVSSAPAATLKH